MFLIKKYQLIILWCKLKSYKRRLNLQEISETLQGYCDEAGHALGEQRLRLQKIRKMQHELIEQHNLKSQSVGEGTARHLKIVGGKDFQQKDVS